MKGVFTAAALTLAVLGAGSFGAARAQTAERVYDNGTVWRVSEVETKPGMFNDYIKYLSTSWRAAQEASKKTGDVISYKVLVVDSPRDHEANVILMVEYRDMAVFDRSMKESDAQTAAVFGSVARAQESAVAREAMRTTHGQALLRELKFTN
jgi:hypothetical protein